MAPTSSPASFLQVRAFGRLSSPRSLGARRFIESGAALRRRRSVVGFTLVELMVSVVVVGVLAVAASPRFLALYRDRRVLAAAAAAADLVRFARSQAIGRGGATMVRYSAAGGANGRPLIEVREAIQASGAPLPLASCLLPNWTNASTTSRELTRQDYGNGMWSLASFEFTSDAGTAQTFAEVCFTPRGRTFVRYQAGAAWVALQGVPRIRVTNSDTLYDRFVFLPPNGVARVQM